MLRQSPEGGRGVSQLPTIADKGGGSENFSTKGFYVNKSVDREGNWFRFDYSWYKAKPYNMQIGL